MSWHYSQALEAAFSGDSSADSAQCAPSNMTTTPAVSSWPDRMTDASNPSLSGTMCEPSTASHGVDWWTSSLAASRAKTSAWQGQAKDLMERKADSGGKWQGSLAKWDRASCSWKTRQLLLFSGEPESLETLPRWGMMRDGELWAAVTPALPTIESERSEERLAGSHGRDEGKARVSHDRPATGDGAQDGRGMDWWASEPSVGRMVHGLAHRAHRLRCTGNGQIPAVVRLAWDLLKPMKS